MSTALAFIVFPAGLTVLIVSTHFLLRSGGRLGIEMGMRPFVVGALIIAFGTSLPEVSVAFFSALNGLFDVPVAQTVGSNIANMLLVLGIVSLIIHTISVNRNLVDVELPLITAVTALFLFVVYDARVVLAEGLFLLAGFVVYTLYVLLFQENRLAPEKGEEAEAAEAAAAAERRGVRALLNALIFAVSLGGILISSQYVIEATEVVASFFGVPEALIAITVLALGTSLPEIVVSLQAALRGEIELVIGNIIGSNIFNILFVVGLPSLVGTLSVDPVTLQFGVPVLIGATLVFIVSGISNRFHVWEGLFYILMYLLFVSKIVGLL